MKKVYLVFEYHVKAEEGVDEPGSLENIMDDGWNTIESVTVCGDVIVYILSRAVGTGETEGFNSPVDYLNRIDH